MKVMGIRQGAKPDLKSFLLWSSYASGRRQTIITMYYVKYIAYLALMRKMSQGRQAGNFVRSAVFHKVSGKALQKR